MWLGVIAGVSSHEKLAPPLPKEKLFGYLQVWALLYLDAILSLPLPTSYQLREEMTHLKPRQVEAASVSLRQALPGSRSRVAPLGVTPKWPVPQLEGKVGMGPISRIPLDFSGTLSAIYLTAPRAGLGLQQVVGPVLTSNQTPGL